MKNVILVLALLCISTAIYAQDSWQQIDAGISDGIHDIEITPNGTIFIYTYGTGKILSSNDTESNWKVVANLDSIYFEQIQFIDDKQGWICGEYGKIYRTRDGGDTWQDQSIRVDNGNLLLYGLLFLDDKNGMVSGAIMKDRKLVNKIYQTEDGGESWQEADVMDVPIMVLNLEKSLTGEIWGSGGNTIIKFEKDNWQIMFYDSTRSTGQIRDLLFLNQDTILGVSFNGKIVISVDGGTSWASSSITPNRLRSIAEMDKRILITAGDNNKEQGNIFISKDSGASWTGLDKDMEDIHRIAVLGSDFWLVGKNGTIIKLK